MSETLIVALIGFAATVFGSLISLLIGLRSSSLERERLKTDNNRLQSEIQDRIGQEKVREAEIERLKAEKEKITAEIDKLRRETERITYQPYEAELAQVQTLLSILDELKNFPIEYNERTVETYQAMRRTHALLRDTATLIIHDPIVRDNLQKIRELFQQVEVDVKTRCPLLLRLAQELESSTINSEEEISERLRALHREINYLELIPILREKYNVAQELVVRIQGRFNQLNNEHRKH